MKKFCNKTGSVLILNFIILGALIAILTSFLYMTSIESKVSGNNIVDSKLFWLAEAGMQKAIWNLKTPVANGGQGEDWTTTGTTESFGNGTYTMEVDKFDRAADVNNCVASVTDFVPGHGPENINDPDNNTYWESPAKPVRPDFEAVVLAFPSPITIAKARFVVPPISNEYIPKEYSWQVSSDGVNYTTVFFEGQNTETAVTNIFPPVSDVNFLRFKITKVQGGSGCVARIGKIKAVAHNIISTANLEGFVCTIEQTAVVDEATQTASDQIDWNVTYS